MKIKTKLVRYLVIPLFCLLLTPMAALADLGPKPTADINVTLNGAPVADKNFEAKMLVCAAEGDNSYYEYPENEKPKSSINPSEFDASRNCYWKIAYLAWGGDCADAKCNFHYYLPGKFRLAINLPSSGKTYYSDEVSRKNFNSTFAADIKEDGTITLVETTTFAKSDFIPNTSKFLLAFFLTMIFEILAALIYFSITKLDKKILKTIILGNVITHPIVWFVSPLAFNYSPGYPLALWAGELFAFLFEAWFIATLNKGIITKKQALWLSLVINLTSWIIGGFIYQVMMIFSQKLF